MDMQMIYAMIWILFIAAVVFLGIFFGKRLGKMKQEKQQAKLEYENKKEKYSYLKPGVLDDCPREDVAAAVLFHCMRKEDEDFDHYFENMMKHIHPNFAKKLLRKFEHLYRKIKIRIGGKKS